MSNWEIDDDTLMKYVENMEVNIGDISNDATNDVIDFVPETQFDFVPETQFVDISESSTSRRSGKGIQVEDPKPEEDVVVERNLNKRKELRIGEHPPPRTCYCGYHCEVVVCRNKKNAGRRFYGCTWFQNAQLQPHLFQHCNFFEWVDPPLCRRGVEYALKM